MLQELIGIQRGKEHLVWQAGRLETYQNTILGLFSATMKKHGKSFGRLQELALPPHIHGILVLLQAVHGITRVRCADNRNGSLHCDGGGGGKEVDAGKYCSFPTYFNLWKHDFPDLKVRQPVEDICMDCYAFETTTGILRIAQWDAMMVMAKATATAMARVTTPLTPTAETARANIAMMDTAMTAATMMAATTFLMLESAQYET